MPTACCLCRDCGDKACLLRRGTEVDLEREGKKVDELRGSETKKGGGAVLKAEKILKSAAKTGERQKKRADEYCGRVLVPPFP